MVWLLVFGLASIFDDIDPTRLLIDLDDMPSHPSRPLISIDVAEMDILASLERLTSFQWCNHVTIKKQIDGWIYENPKDDFQAFLHKNNSDAFLFIRGTSGLKQWQYNFDLKLENISTILGFGYGKVHRGHAQLIQQNAKEVVKRLQDTEYERLFISGYSLGGSLAPILQMYLYEKHNISSTSIGLLAALYGDMNLKQYAAKTNLKMIKYVRKYDLFSFTPSKAGYVVIGEEWFDKGDEIIKCDPSVVVDKRCGYQFSPGEKASDLHWSLPFRIASHFYVRSTIVWCAEQAIVVTLRDLSGTHDALNALFNCHDCRWIRWILKSTLPDDHFHSIAPAIPYIPLFVGVYLFFYVLNHANEYINFVMLLVISML